MVDKRYLLTDDQMRHFIVNGYVIVNTDLPASFHDFIYEQTEIVFEKEGNPGNNLLPRIPEIQGVFDDKRIIGGLTSVLGEDYYMQPHRHAHFNQPKSEGQQMHQDSGKEWSHHTRRLLVFYYPQDTPLELGPTAILPGSHYYNTPDGAAVSNEFPICGKAGTVAIVNYDLWHRAMPNRTDKNRYMMKFLSARMSEPRSPSWNNEQTQWNQSEPTGNHTHQKMFQHIWDWHYGRTNGNTPTNGKSMESVPELIEELGNDSESRGLSAAYALSEFGESAVPALMEAFEDESEAIRRNAYYALSAMGAPTVKPLISSLRHLYPQIREVAAEALGDIGSPAQAAVPALVAALEDESERVRFHAAEALGTVSQEDSTAIPALSAALRDENERVRQDAALALARIGPYAADAVGALGAVFSDGNMYVRGDAVHALYRIGTPEAREILLRFLMRTRWCSVTDRASRS
ncbi:phytanoyl-CoA dioxygenase [Candidatus Poribacteria bacterium]|nr:MAG: phytanoyl-CoA dioxygenase [Candidatus Poribacteria bacterium]